MQFRSVRALVEICILSTALTLAGCGSGSSSFQTSPPPPAPAEFLYTTSYGSILVFSLNPTTGVLTEEPSGPLSPGGFGIAANPSNTFLYSIDDYVGGVDASSISQTGALSAVSGSPFLLPDAPPGFGSPPVDSLAMHPSGNFLYAPDPPANEVVGFAIDSTTGALTPVPGSPFPTGTQPEQVVIDPSGQFLYVSDFSGWGISGFTISSSTGALTTITGSPFFSDGDPDGIVVHPSGKFLYCTNTYENSIAAFTIDQTTGVLAAVPDSPFSLGLGVSSAPYSMAQDPAGKFLYVLGSGDGNIYEFAVDANSGALTPATGSPVHQGLGLDASSLTVDPAGKYLYFSSQLQDYIHILNIDGTTGALSWAAESSVSADGFPLGLTIVTLPQQ
ncbi:MAG: beta-propeller fold lactonase family protein [Candidatus Sulfotelmatobacter sp.]|jgi:6-phosphogluconolactonase (cycloisomerase 2 family)